MPGPSDANRPPDAEGFLDLLGWPPPGLARIQGDLWILVRKVYMGAAVLVLPLLYAVSSPQSEVGLGPVGDAWWVLVVSTAIGLGLFLDGVISAVRALRRASDALSEGYGPRVVALVMADRERDSGFLLQGAQEYSMLTAPDRDALVRVRIWATLACLAAAIWLVLGFGVLALLGARGAATPATLAIGTLGPTVLLQALGVALLATGSTLRRRARRSWFAQHWARALMERDAEAWREAAARRDVAGASGPSRSLPVGALSVVAVAAAIVAITPPVTLTPVSSIGAILGSITGSFATTAEQRSARAEAYRPLKVEVDPAIGAIEAGEILNTLLYVGDAERATEGMRPPARSYESRFVPQPPDSTWRVGIPAFWTDTVWAAVRRGLSAEERAFLEEVASHPAHAELERLARAGSVDVLGGRYTLPLDSSWTIWSVPFPRFGALREGADAHLGVAALHGARGRWDEAEKAAREVLSVGLLMMDDAPTLVENAIGSVLVRSGGRALEQILLLSGRSSGAEGLRASVDAADRAVERMSRAQRAELGVEAFFEYQMATVADADAQRALRWEFLGSVVGLTPCLNLQRMVFGPGEEYAAWLEGVRASLVRYPSEQAYYELSLRGMAAVGEVSVLSRLLSISMGGRGEPGSCTQLVDALPAIM